MRKKLQLFSISCLLSFSTLSLLAQKGVKPMCTVTVSPSGNATICSGNSTSISVAITGGGTAPYSYQWSPVIGLSNPSTTGSALSNNGTMASPTTTTSYSVMVTDGGGCTGSAVVLVQVNAPLTAPTAGNNGTITSGQTLSLTASTIAGASYSWSGPNGFTSTIQNPIIPGATPANSGSYSVTATVIGCGTSPAGITNATVMAGCSQPTAQAAGFNNTGINCTGMTVLWTRGNGNNVLVIAKPGGPCTDPASGTSYIANAAYGAGSAVGGGFCVYNGIGTSVVLTGLTSGTNYYFSVYEYNTSGFCYKIPALIGNASTSPPAPATPGAINGGVNQCPNLTGLMYTVAPVTNATGYTWAVPSGWTITAGAGTNTITVTSGSLGQNGNITVTANNICGTSAASVLSVSVVSTLSAPTAGSNSPVNAGQNLSLSTNFIFGATYSWAGPNSFSSSMQNPVIGSVTTSFAGNYSVTITVSGCGTSPVGTTSVIINPSCTPPTVTPSSNVTICKGGSTTLSESVSGGTPPYTYNWFPTGGVGCSTCPNAPVSPSHAMTYTVKVTDNTGCSQSATTSVAVNDVPFFGLGNTGTFWASTVVNDVSMGSYSWVNPSNAQGGTDDNIYATVNLTPVNTSNYLKATGFGITVPGNAIIRGVKMQVEWFENNPNTIDSVISLVKGGVIQSFNMSKHVVLPTSETLQTYGDTSDTWGIPLTVTDVQDPGFGVAIAVKNFGTSTTVSVDRINMTVFYTLPPAIAGGPSTVCVGSSSTFSTGTGVGASTYTWSVPAGSTINSGQGTTAINVTFGGASGNISVAANNSCGTSASGSYYVTVNPTPSTPVAGSNSPVIVGQMLSLTASTVAGATYSWSGPISFSSTQQNPMLGSVTTAAAGTYSVTASANGCVSGIGTTSVVINNCTPPTVNVSPIHVSCYGMANGSANAIVSGGITPYTYLWSTSSSMQNITALSAGNYSVTVTDAVGCSQSQSVTINQPPILSVTPSQSNISCFGGADGSATALSSGGTPAYSYSWNPSGQTSQSATSLSVGNYTVTVTDANSCVKTSTFAITQPAAALTASISASINVSCNGSASGSATVNASGGTPTYNFAWNPTGGSAATANALAAGNYTATVTDSKGCISSASVSITQPAALTVSTSVSNAGCGSSNGSAQAFPGGGTAPYTYSWSANAGSQTTATATGLAAGSYTVMLTDNKGCGQNAIANVSNNSAPTIAISSVSNVSCNGGNNGMASITAAGGSTPYTYSWSSGQTTTAATGLAAGIYNISVTDALGCIGTNTVSISAPPAITITIASSNIHCHGGNDGSASATVSGGTPSYLYNWSSGAVTQTANSLLAGNYTLTVTDANSCAASKTVSLTEPTVLSASIGSSTNVSCNGGNDGSATASAAGGTPTYAYSWSPSGGNAATANNLVAGSYSVTITDINGCTQTNSVSITQPTALSASIASSTNVSCNGGNNGSATASAAGGTPVYAYVWSPTGGNSATANNLSAGNYSITVTDANGCTQVNSVSITQPTVMTSTKNSTNVSCNGGANGTAGITISGGNPSYSYSWSNSSTLQNITGLSAGTFVVNVWDANSCSISDTVLITEPSAITLSVTSTNVSCNGQTNGSATATVSGGTAPFIYAWNPGGGNTATANNLAAGNYSVTLTDANGCTNVNSVSVLQPAVLTTSITSTNVSCSGQANGSATVAVTGGSSPFTYVWNPGGGSAAVANNLVSGNYSVTVTDANGCTSANAVAINQPTPISVVPHTVGFNCSGLTTESVTATGGTPGYAYLWSPSSQNTQTATGLSAGTYSITVTDANVCVTTITVVITQPAVLSGSVAVTNASCFGTNSGSATAAVNGGVTPYAFSWSNGEVTQTATGLSSGTYYVSVFDANGCALHDSAVISQPLQIPLTVSVTSTSCGNSSGTASATVSGAGSVPPFKYLWATGNTNASINNLSAGIYRVNVTDGNGCFSFADALIANSNGPTVTPNSVVGISCSGLIDGSASINISGGTTPYTYSWSNGATTQNISGLAFGPYDLKTTDASGCIAQLTVFINQPLPLILTTSAVNSSCKKSNGSVTAILSGGTLPYSYLWNASSATTSSVAGLAAGVYSVAVTDSHGCTAAGLTAVSDSTGPRAAIDTIAAANCGGSGFALLTPKDSSAIAGYSWTTGGNTQNLSSAAPGNYGVTITDTNGCKSALLALVQPVLPPIKPICLVTVDSNSTKNIVVWEKPISTFVAGFNIYRESSTNGIYQKAGYVPYSSLSEFFDTIVNPDSRWAKYRISMTDVCGMEGPLCAEHKTIHLSLQPSTSTSHNLIWDAYEGNSFAFYHIFRKANLSGSWVLVDSVPSAVTTYSDVTFNPLDTNYYHIDVSPPQGGCIATIKYPDIMATNLNTSRSNVYRVTDSSAVAVHEINYAGSVSVYPNPSKGAFTVQIFNQHVSGADVNIANVLGEKIYSIKMNSSRADIDLSDRAGGIYFITIKTQEGIAKKKIIISK